MVDDPTRVGWLIGNDGLKRALKARAKNPLEPVLDRLALDYKVRIEALGEAEILSGNDTRQQIRSYFGNTGEATKKKFGVTYPDGVRIDIFCSRDDLSEHIRQHLQTFFYLHNFGTRQSKGIGSFTLARLDGKGVSQRAAEAIRQHYKNHVPGLAPYKLVLQDNPGDPVPRGRWPDERLAPLECIRIAYGLMKSGFNFPPPGTEDYFRGYLREYPVGVVGDKDAIKSVLAGKAVPPNARFYRALLGTGDRAKWGDRGEVVFDPPATIGRVPSPLLFSVAENGAIFLLPRPIPAAVLNAKFTITPHSRPGFTLATPQSFDLAGFLAGFAAKLNDKAATWWPTREGPAPSLGEIPTARHPAGSRLLAARYLRMEAL
jgi:hypothetical protein